MMLAAAGSSALADSIVFDPDNGGNSPRISLNTFQYGAGNSLAMGAIPFTDGDTFQFLFHAQLNSVVTDTAVQITPNGLNAPGFEEGAAPFEITVVGSVTEEMTNVNEGPPMRATFKLASVQSTASFVEIYFDATPDANPLLGMGYNDGILILRGIPTPATPNVGTFSLTNPQPNPLPSFDSFGNNDYATAGAGGANISSVTGVGATKLDVTITYVDATFFVEPAFGDSGRRVRVGDVMSFDSSQAAPFDKIEPSRRFAIAPNTGTGSGPTPTYTPAVGAVNGTSGPDFQTQTLAASSVSGSPAPTPTPTPTPTPSPTPTVTPSPTVTPTPTPTTTPTKVTVQSSREQLREGADATITFSVNQAIHPAITVNYSTAIGTATLNVDYTLSGTPGMVVIPANAPSATILLHSIVDSVRESDGETARILIEPGTGYQVPAGDNKRTSVLILDRP